MSLEQQINSDIKAAMMAKDKVRLTAVRAVKAAILLAKTSEGAHEGELSDVEVVKIIQKLVKQRKESAEIYNNSHREELAQNELEEASFLEPYLPKELSEAELEAALKEIITRTGATCAAHMGKVMGTATKELAGRADGKAISAKVKQLLS